MEASNSTSMYAFYLPDNEIRNSLFWSTTITYQPYQCWTILFYLVRSPRDTWRNLGSRLPWPAPNGAWVPDLLPYSGDRAHTEQTCCRHAMKANCISRLQLSHQLYSVSPSLSCYCLWESRNCPGEILRHCHNKAKLHRWKIYPFGTLYRYEKEWGDGSCAASV